MNMSYQNRSKCQLAARVALDIPKGAYVNLGIGMPTQVANFIPSGREIILHIETAFLAWGRRRPQGKRTMT